MAACSSVNVDFILLILLLVPVIAASSVHSEDRTISIVYNPNCTTDACHNTSDYKNLVYVKAEGTQDIIHYLWSSIGAPTILLVRTSKDAELRVNWDKVLNSENGGIVFVPSSEVTYSMALVISRLIEYNDSNNNADLETKNTTKHVTLLQNLQWQDMSLSINETKHTALMMTTLYQPLLKENGTISIQLRAFATHDRSDILPHLLYTSNTTQMDVSLNGLVPMYKASRFAIEMLAIKNGHNAKKNISIHMSRSIDDEYTPGMFKVYELHLPSQPPSHYGGYCQWKPVCYGNQIRDLANALEVKYYDEKYTDVYIPSSIINNYFVMDQVDMTSFNISFGTPKDGFYNATRYTGWTVNIAYGTPPEDQLSLLIIIVISAGLGLPVFLIFVGGIIICVRKRKEKYKELHLVVN
ncbi:glycosylated lysosomal membrane protein A-like [Saccoglossus kowalevskii]|uniref:Lysosomal protein NCU-G1-A-like n=1 Tax=Saccoglossus kowalevskii TaxID=10224 RepID=A0ABM0LTX7_SACKO|nr:PREDICTED: lysosomal protein NCU-G1-A-like [Saccoglossus kowalevskii]